MTSWNCTIFYRALDFLAEYKERIELDLFDSTRNLFDLEVDMIFWNTVACTL
nr:hypothetical protein [Desulfofundulus australicus]